MRLVLIALVFQVVCPLILSIVVKTDISGSTNAVIFQEDHHSLVAPQLLKEKEESESKEEIGSFRLFTLIDFSDLTSTLSASHNTRISRLRFHDRINYRPPLFTIHRSLLI